MNCDKMRSRVFYSSMLIVAAIGIGTANLSRAQTVVTSETPSVHLLNETFQ
jgi:hypothetical protein